MGVCIFKVSASEIFKFCLLPESLESLPSPSREEVFRFGGNGFTLEQPGGPGSCPGRGSIVSVNQIF